MPPNTSGPTPDSTQAGAADQSADMNRAVDHLNELHVMRGREFIESANIDGVVATVRSQINDILENNEVLFDDLGDPQLFHRNTKGSKALARIQNTVNSAEGLRNAVKVIDEKMDPTVDGSRQRVKDDIARVINTSVGDFKAASSQRSGALNQTVVATPQASTVNVAASTVAPASSGSEPAGNTTEKKKNIFKRGWNTFIHGDENYKPASTEKWSAYAKRVTSEGASSGALKTLSAASYVTPVTKNFYTKTVPFAWKSLNILSGDFWLWESLGISRKK